MKILELNICNFKNYQGLHKIILSPEKDGSKNIILIGGENGSGKTTIFEAVKLCMFGKQFRGNVLPNKSYLKYINDSKNKESIIKDDIRYYIEIIIELDDIFPVYSIDLKREWSIKNGEIKEEFTILRDGISLEIVSQEYWEDYITRMIPPYITDYFFFDGERMNELTEGDNAETILRESSRDLIGLKLYETLIRDIDSLGSKIKRKSVVNDTIKKEIDKFDKMLTDLEEDLKIIESGIIFNSTQIIDSEEQLSVLQSEVQRKAGSLAKERTKLSEELILGKDKLIKLNSEIVKICEYVPFVMAGGITQRTLDKLVYEKKTKELVANKHLIDSINKCIDSKISEKFSTSFDEYSIKKVQVGLEEILSEMVNEMHINERDDIIHDITNESFHSVKQCFSVIEEKGKNNFKRILKERETLELRLNKIENKLKMIPNDPIVKEDIQKINYYNDLIIKYNHEQKKLEGQKITIESMIKPLKIKLNDLESGFLKDEEDRKKVLFCKKVNESLNEFIEIILSSKIEELRDMIFSMHSQLENKEDMVGDLIINPKTFAITLFDKNGAIINKNMMSAGEKEIFALSVLWGLSRLSKSKMPVIVDSLLARLDSSHVNKVATHFLPKAGDQVIVLSHDREVDKEIYEKIKPFVNRSYILTYNSIDKVKEGYFF